MDRPPVHLRKKLIQNLAMGRELAHWISLRRVAGEKRRLATTPAEIDFSEGAALARFGQPIGPPEALKRSAALPDRRECLVSNVVKSEAGNTIGSLARENVSAGIYR